MNYNFQRQQIISGYKLIELLGRGGNAEVWKVEKDNAFYAMKLLKEKSKEKLKRFKNEIKILEKVKEISNIINIFDYDKSDSPMWLIMPIGQSSFYYLEKKNVDEKNNFFIKLIEVIKELHSKNITHRDIKPENILIINNTMKLSDFGLGNILENNNNITIESNRKGVGAMATMAPEMRRLSKENYKLIDYKCADVYSLAKTLWIYLSEDKLGFDGEYTQTGSMALENYFNLNYYSLLCIEKLLIKSTKNDPLERPNITEFYEEFKKITLSPQNFLYSNAVNWNYISERIFPTGIPKHSLWIDINSIKNILNIINKIEHYVYFPERGGHTFKTSYIKKNILKINFGSEYLLSIKNPILTFHSFEEKFQTNYFRLECLYKRSYGDKNFKKGVFLIFSKSSTYNQNNISDQKHHIMSDEEFRNFIEKENVKHF